MKKLSKSLLAVLFAVSFLTSCSNEDDNSIIDSSTEKPQVLIETGSSSKGLFIINNTLDKVVYSSGAKEVFEYNSNDKISKITFFTSDSKVLYSVIYNYSSTDVLDNTVMQYTGYNSFKTSNILNSSSNVFNITNEVTNTVINQIQQTYNSSIAFSNNDIINYTTQFNSTDFTFLNSNTYYNSLISFRELAFYFKELALLGDNITEFNIETEDSTGTNDDFYYEYEFDTSNRVNKITKFSTVTDAILETKKISYN